MGYTLFCVIVGLDRQFASFLGIHVNKIKTTDFAFQEENEFLPLVVFAQICDCIRMVQHIHYPTDIIN